MLNDRKLREGYYDSLRSEVNKMRKMNRDEFKKIVDDKIDKVFEGAYIDRLQTMFDKSREAQSLDRRRMLLRLKRYLFSARCVTRSSESHES